MLPVIRFLAIVTICSATAALTWQHTRPAESPGLRQAPTEAPTEVSTDAPSRVLIKQNVPIRSGDTLAELLERAGIDPEASVELVAAVEKEFDVRKLRAGSQLSLIRSEDGVLDSLEYVINPDNKLQLAKINGAFVSRIAEVPGAIRTDSVCGTIKGSLFESIKKAGERPELVVRFAEIFAWDLDFYRDPREGDSFCVLVEKKEYANGTPTTYLRVFAAEYNNAGSIYDAYLFPDENGEPHYYSSDGQALQSVFLRSPLAFDARISSQFSRRRFHPILKVYRPHLGTDYAAPSGTPVRAVAAGSVVFSGRSGDSGNLITIRHGNAYETQYLHLSRKLVRKGERVKQGQRIGLVGATGLATGPHLDLRVRKNGRYVNFRNLKLPRQSRINAEQQDSFNATRNHLYALMKSGSVSDAKIVAGGTAPEATP